MKMISEATAKRIAKALEKLADVAERQHYQMAPSPVGNPPIFDPSKCLYCGVNHGGLQCPHLIPICASRT